MSILIICNSNNVLGQYCDNSKEAIIDGGFEQGGINSTFGEHQLYTYGAPTETYYIGTSGWDYFSAFEAYPHSGNMLLMIDGMLTDTAVAWHQNVTITPGEIYYFSAWVTSLVNSEKCNLRFEVKGNTDSDWIKLGDSSFQAPDIGTWEQIFETWESGANTSAEIRLTNNNPLGYGYNGNDYALDDISFNNGCSKVENAGPEPHLADTLSICGNTKTLELDTKIDEHPNISFTWYKNEIEITGENSSKLSGVNSTGTYVVCVDSVKCIKVDTIVVIDEKPNLELIPKGISCNNSSDGQVIARVKGGKPKIIYDWSNGNNDSIIKALSHGNYTVTLTDGYDCYEEQTFSLSNPDTLTISTKTLKHVHCHGYASGIATASANGGTKDYTFTWSNSIISDTNIRVKAGINYVTVTDSNGCIATDNITLTQPEKITINYIDGKDNTCFGIDDGYIEIDATGGEGNITLDWSGGKMGNYISNLSPGYHTVTATDLLNCKVSEKYFIINNSDMEVDFTPSPNPIYIDDPFCTFYNNTTGTNVIEYLWDFGDNKLSNENEPNHNYKEVGVYNVNLLVKNALGCTDTASQYVEVLDIKTFFVPNSFSPNEDGPNERFLPKGTGINESTYEMMIFNRAGRLVYYTQDLYEGWNGRTNNTYHTTSKTDTYVYLIRFKDISGAVYEYNGKVTLFE